MIAPAVAGAVALTVKAAVAPLARPLLRVTLQLSNAPALEGRLPQLTALTPLPAVTAVATTPAGSWSLRLALVPLVKSPLLPMVST